MMKAKKQEIWVCTTCGNGTPDTSRKDAEQCCVCPECKKPTPTMAVYCDICTAKSDLEWQRKGLESAANNYMHAKTKLATLESGAVILTDRKKITGPFRPDRLVLTVPAKFKGAKGRLLMKKTLKGAAR